MKTFIAFLAICQLALALPQLISDSATAAPTTKGTLPPGCSAELGCVASGSELHDTVVKSPFGSKDDEDHEVTTQKDSQDDHKLSATTGDKTKERTRRANSDTVKSLNETTTGSHLLRDEPTVHPKSSDNTTSSSLHPLFPLHKHDDDDSLEHHD